jgi:hypothetical protein
MQNNQKPKDFGFRDSAFFLTLLASTHAVCLTPLLRRGFGVEAFRPRAVLALVMMLLFAGAQNSGEMYCFLCLWLIAVLGRQAAARRAERRGDYVHSQYQGTSCMVGRFGITDSAAKNVIEPLLCLFAGFCLCPVSEALGGFVMLGFVSLALQRGLEVQLWTNRARRMRDAAIQQRYLADLYRGEEM